MVNLLPNPQTADYQGYKGLPSLVGLESMADAATRGLSVEESVARLKRHHWFLGKLYDVFVFRLTGMPIYEIKMAFSLHLHLCAEHRGEMAKRVKEMREPPYGLEQSPHPGIDLLFAEIQNAPTPEALVLGIYEIAVPALVAGVERHLSEIHRLFDHPSYRVCRHALMEMKDIEEYGRKAVQCLVDVALRAELSEWIALLDGCLQASGGLDGTDATSEALPEPMHSANPIEFERYPYRDERFVEPYNVRVNAEAFLYDERFDPLAKTLMLYFKRMRETDVPEMMTSILYDVKGKPWEYYRAMARQLWDEARHAMMGEIGFVATGIPWEKIPFSIGFSLGLNKYLTPAERHAVLYSIEQSLMPAKRGKKEEWEIAVASTSRLCALMQDFDWADEVLHAKIGREWLVKEVGPEKAKELGGAWMHMPPLKPEGEAAEAPQDRNWWPEVYELACEQWEIEPDPEALAYATPYARGGAEPTE